VTVISSTRSSGGLPTVRQMPDHVFDALIDRVDRTPQRRLAGLVTRYLNMPLNIRFTAVAATVVIAIAAVGAWALAGRTARTWAEDSMAPPLRRSHRRRRRRPFRRSRTELRLAR